MAPKRRRGAGEEGEEGRNGEGRRTGTERGHVEEAGVGGSKGNGGGGRARGWWFGREKEARVREEEQVIKMEEGLREGKGGTNIEENGDGERAEGGR